jgi:hypothetical protein
MIAPANCLGKVPGPGTEEGYRGHLPNRRSRGRSLGSQALSQEWAEEELGHLEFFRQRNRRNCCV